MKLELLELPAKGKAAEGAAILGRVNKGELLVALDERGAQLDSVELSELLRVSQLQAKDLLFVIGGDDGLDPSVLKAAYKTLSLSRLTLPHRLARVVLMEQLYRGFTILKGEPYHRA